VLSFAAVEFWNQQFSFLLPQFFIHPVFRSLVPSILAVFRVLLALIFVRKGSLGFLFDLFSDFNRLKKFVVRLHNEIIDTIQRKDASCF